MSIFRFIKNLFDKSSGQPEQIIIPLSKQPDPCSIIFQAAAEFNESKNIVVYNRNNDINIEKNLTPEEKIFFACLTEKAKISGLTGYFVAKPHTSHYFDVDYIDKFGGCWVGRICLWKPVVTKRYAVIKEGANRASQIFDDEADAKHYVNTHKKNKYNIILRPVDYSRFMDYLIYSPSGDDKLKSITGENLYLYISGINHWITFINHYLVNK